jgi:hypothetical protein
MSEGGCITPSFGRHEQCEKSGKLVEGAGFDRHMELTFNIPILMVGI